MRIITCQVNSGAGCSVWQYLKGCHGCSRRFLNRLKQGRGSLFLGGAPVESVARTLLREGDILSLVLEEETVDFIPNAALSAPVVYEDEDLVVFNKPPGMPVHPSHRHLEDTLANLFAARWLVFTPSTGWTGIHPVCAWSPSTRLPPPRFRVRWRRCITRLPKGMSLRRMDL